MKLNTSTSVVERSNVLDEHNFSIKTTAKSFEILSKGIYSDPILAVIRELACNAYDAHVEAGKGDTPFEVHLPNIINPYFSIKDYGVGLSEDQVMTLYTTYFESTKTESNDFIGALGLGSKSPFAYTTAFEVISRYEGTQSIFSVFLNEQGVPTIAKMGEIPTLESNGLEVKITVSDNDFRQFIDKTATALKWFSPAPIVKGHNEFEFDPLPQHSIRGKDWMLYRRVWSAHHTAVQGNVQYNINLKQLQDHISSELYEALTEINSTLFFDIGDLDIAASREELQYSDHTVNNLLKKCQGVANELIDKISNDISNFNCTWEVFAFIHKKFVPTFNTASKLVHFLTQSTKNIENEHLKEFIECFGILNINHYHAFDVKVRQYSYSTNKLTSKKEKIIIPHETSIVVFCDARNSVKRIKHYISQLNETPRHIITIDKKAAWKIIEGKKISLTQQEIQQEFENICDELGNPKIIIASEDLQSPASTKSTEKIITYTPYIDEGKIRWSSSELSSLPSGGGLYLELYGGHTPLYQDISLNNHFPAEQLMLLFSKAVINQTVVGVNRSSIKHFESDDSWTELGEYVSNNLVPELLEDAWVINNWVDVRNSFTIIQHEKAIALFEELPKSSPFYKHLAAIKVLQHESNKAKEHLSNKTQLTINDSQINLARFIISWAQTFSIDVQSQLDLSLILSEDQIYEMYPMLKYTSEIFKGPHYYYSGDHMIEMTKDAVKYITLIDNEETNK